MTQAGDASAMNAGSQGSQQGGAAQGGAQGGAAQGAGVMDQAKDTVQQVAGQAKEVAGQAKEQATQRVQGVFDQGKSRAAEQLTGVAQTLRQTTEQLKSGGQLAFAAPYLDRGVSQLERLAEYVRTADLRDVAQQAESFARRQPAAFLGILFTTGLAGARFLKSSQRDAVQPSPAGARYPSYGATGYGAGSYSAGGYGDASGTSGSGSGASYGGSSYGGTTSGGTSGGLGGASSAGGSYTGSQAGSQGASSVGLSGSAGGFYDDAGTARTSRTSGSTGSSGGSTADASDERGMDIGPTSSGLRGDI